MRVLSFVVRIARCSVPSSSSLRSIPILGCTSSPLVTHPPKKLANTNAIITTTTTTLHASFSSFSSSSFSSSTPRRWSLSLFFRANLQQQQHHHPRHGAHPTIPMLRRRSFLTTTTTMLSKQKTPQKNSKQKQHEQQQQQQQQIKLQRQREIVDRIRSAMLHLISASSNSPPASKAAENTTNDVAASITTTTTTGKDLVEQIISIAQQQSNNNNNNSNSALSKDARDDCILAFDVAIRTLVSSNKIDLARSLFEELLAMRTMGTDSNIITPPTDYDQGGPDPILTLFHTLIAQLCLGGHWSEVRPMLLDQQLARSIGEVTKSADPITMTNNNSNNKNNNHHNDYHYENDRVWSEIYRIYLDTLCKTNEFQRALKLFYQIANEVNNNNNNSSSSSSNNRNSKSQASPSNSINNSISTNPIIVNVNEYYVPPRLGGGNTALCNVIIKGMIHNGRIDDAVKLLGVMHATAESAESDREKDDPLYSIRPDVGSYNAFISEYIARAKRATQLLHRLASGSYVPPQQMMAINKMMIIDNTRGSRIQWNRGGSSSSRNNPKMNAKVMLKMYRKESLKRAREYLEKMQQEHGGGGGVKPDLTTYGAFISYYCKEGTASSMQEAMQWVSRMQQDKIEVELGDGKTKKVSRLVPDTSIFNMLIEGFGRSRQLDSALQCYEELARQKHCRPNAITLNVLIDTCSFNNRLDLALQFFQDAYNRQLQLQQQQQQQEPIQLQQKQQQQPSKRRHQQKQQKQKQKQQHDTDEDDDEEFIVELDINHYTSIIEACGRHRDDKTARKIFGLLLEQMHKQLVATTTSSSSAAAFANTMHTTATAKHHHHHHHGVLLLYPTAKLFRTLIYNVYIANQKQHAARKLVMELIKNTKNGNINNNNSSNNNKQKKQRQQQQQQQQHDADTNIPSFRLVEPALSEFVKFLAHPKARRDLGIADETYLQFLYSQYGPDAKMPSVAEAAAAAEEKEAEEAGVEIL